ncbi:MAG: hypothetical protein ACXVCM_24230, partial [Ktedonobacteraceae bacterium]
MGKIPTRGYDFSRWNALPLTAVTKRAVLSNIPQYFFHESRSSPTHFFLHLPWSLALALHEVQNCVCRALVAACVAHMPLHRLSVRAIVGVGE